MKNTSKISIVLISIVSLAIPSLQAQISPEQADSIMEKYLLYYDSIQSQPLLLSEDDPASRSWYPYSTYLLTGDTLFQDTAAFPGALRWSQNAYVYFIKSHLPVYGPTPECFFSIDRNNGQVEEHYAGEALGYARRPFMEPVDILWNKEPVIHISQAEASNALDRYLSDNYGNLHPYPYRVYAYPDSTKNNPMWPCDPMGSDYRGYAGTHFSYYYDNTFTYMLAEETDSGTTFRYLAALKNDPAIHIPDGDFYLVAHIEENGVYLYDIPDSAIEIIDPFIYRVGENAAEPLNLDEWPLIRSYEPTANKALQVENKALLFYNVPNPFSSVTRIRYTLLGSRRSADLQILDLQGRPVQRLALDKNDNNEVEICLDGHAPGLYIGILRVDGIPADRIRLIKAH